MKHFTLATLMVSALVASQPALGATSPLTPRQQARVALKSTNQKSPLKKAANKKSVAKAAPTAPHSYPTRLEVYVTDPATEEWTLSETQTLTYDQYGKVVSTVSDEGYGDLYRTVYSYDNYGNCTLEVQAMSEDEGETWEETQKNERQYSDPIVHTYCTSNEIFYADGGEWYQGMGNHFAVTRNSDNNVTKVEVQVLYQGAYDPTLRVEMDYADGAKSPVTRTSYQLDYDWNTGETFWVEGAKLTDITWERCDGQILTLDDNDLLQGNNRLASATLWNGDTPAGQMTVEYTGASDFIATTTSHDDDWGSDDTEVHSYRVVDENGSFIEKFTYTYDYGDGDIEEYTESYKVTYDEFGNYTGEMLTVDMDEESYVEFAIVNELTYDDEGRLIETLVWSYDPETEEMYAEERIVASDFVTPSLSGVTTVEAAQAEATIAEIYAIDGTRRSTLTNGLNIVRYTDGTVKKLLINK